MWQAAVMAAGAIIGGIGNAKQEKAQKRAAQKQINSNYTSANKNIKQLEKQARTSAQTQQSDVATARRQAAEARSAAEINGGIEGQTSELYKDQVLRELDSDLGASDLKFEQYNQNLLATADEIAYNTNVQNKALAEGASTSNAGLNAISTGLNIASAYYSGLNTSSVNNMSAAKTNNKLTNNGLI